MWALICDTNDGELRVVSEGTARKEYLNADRRANKYNGKWELQATDTDKELLLAMARLTGGREETLDYAVCFFRG